MERSGVERGDSRGHFERVASKIIKWEWLIIEHTYIGYG